MQIVWVLIEVLSDFKHFLSSESERVSESDGKRAEKREERDKKQRIGVIKSYTTENMELL